MITGSGKWNVRGLKRSCFNDKRGYCQLHCLNLTSIIQQHQLFHALSPCTLVHFVVVGIHSCKWAWVLARFNGLVYRVAVSPQSIPLCSDPNWTYRWTQRQKKTAFSPRMTWMKMRQRNISLNKIWFSTESSKDWVQGQHPTTQNRISNFGTNEMFSFQQWSKTQWRPRWDFQSNQRG